MRYLFVTWDGGGNLHTLLALGQRLAGRGHEVEFLGHRSQQAAIEAKGCGFAAFQRVPDTAPSTSDAAMINDWEARSHLHQAAIYRDKLMIGPAGLFAADVIAEIDRFQPDAVAVDCMILGAIAGAERSGLPSAVIWHCNYAPPNVEVPLLPKGHGLPRGMLGRLRQKTLRGLTNGWWNRSLPALNATRAELGLEPLAELAEQCDRLDRTLVASSAAFDFAALSGVALPENLRYIGPQVSVGEEAGRGEPDREEPPFVLVGFSTTYQAQQPLLERAIDALGSLPVRALVTTGPAVSIERPLPANVEVRAWVAHSEVLPRASLVLTHGGHGTVMASIAHGGPLICIPMGRDQPSVAARVVHAGCGLRLPSGASRRRIAETVRRVLSDPSMKTNAERLGAVVRKEIAADAGVAELEGLVRLQNAEVVPSAVK